MSSVNDLSDLPGDLLEFPFGLIELCDEELMPESFRPTLIEAVLLPPINLLLPSTELYQLENAPNVNGDLLDISHNQIENISQTVIQNSLNNVLNNQDVGNNEDNSNGVTLDSNANLIKLMEAKNKLEELTAVKRSLKNEHLQLKNENNKIKKEIIEYVKINNIQFDTAMIMKSIKRKNTATSLSSPVLSTSTCSFDNPKRSRGRPNKDLNKAEEELEKLKLILSDEQLRTVSNNVASIRTRENKKKMLEELYAEEKKLIELNEDLNEKYTRNKKYIVKIINAAIKSAKKL